MGRPSRRGSGTSDGDAKRDKGEGKRAGGRRKGGPDGGGGDRLAEYRRKRDPGRTPEPVPAGPLPHGDDDTFVIQEHHARALHWDLRLERDGVLVSWAVPRGLPPEPGVNRLAVHTEDHPVEYAAFAGTIPAGEYGAGSMSVWDRGTYRTEEWTDRKVTVELAGGRVAGRYALFATDGRNWLVRRLDPPSDPARVPMPRELAPMLPVRQAGLPRPASAYAYEVDWGGVRVVGFVASGRLRLVGVDGEVAADRRISRAVEALGATEAVLDGELVTLDGAPVYVVSDLLYLDGVDLTVRSQEERWALLDGLPLAGGCQLAPRFDDGPAVREAARERHLPGVLAKRRDAPYRPGVRSAAWKRVAVAP
ncbi:DNA polymerase ligase N-terminal domain-containing protein [Actinocatenispora rupis]|uniref:ATP-dependent DNA ligase n=1 Tax=Actinocatenispora rupis TaxID=519421 RepID=A0A8J3NBP8_9ACTN|nr:ATP-dependent DNA ligase [Actinocatenispora rupis]